MKKPDGMNNRWEAVDPLKPGVESSYEEVEQMLRRETLYGQSQQLRDAWIDLGGQVAKMLRLQEIATWAKKFLRRLIK